MEEILKYSYNATSRISTEFVRYLVNTVNWESRLIEILGGRGTGKTTLMLQRVKLLNNLIPNQAIYISLDDHLMYKHSIVDVTEELVNYGVKYLFLDEVHKYPPKLKGFDWSAEIKNIYDRYPELHVVYSGSSILNIYKGMGDLSRRKTSYKLEGLSFREYLEFGNVINFDRIKLTDILNDHVEISRNIANKIKIIPHFNSYLKMGYFPFFKEDPNAYYARLNNVMNVILETDIPSVSEITFETTLKIKKLLSVIASSAPYVPNLLKIRNELHITDQRTLLKYLDFLDKADVIRNLSQSSKGSKLLQKPDKVLIANTNFIYSLQTANSEIGTIRESFFASQLNVNHSISIPTKGDFKVDDTLVFEIGGKNKSTTQIRNIERSYLAKDNIEIGAVNQVPLWLFGFLY